MDSALQEVRSRSRLIRRRREKRILRNLAAGSATLCAALVAVVGTRIHRLDAGGNTSLFGAFVLPDSAGGYVLAGVIAFFAGVVFTLLCIRWRERRNAADPPDRREGDPSE